ncbi:DUF4190 domain-containing protein [Streptomyces sp. SID4950]|nr:DUF4190 domain-containing protein [Streptomyces sp. SID4950]
MSIPPPPGADQPQDRQEPQGPPPQDPFAAPQGRGRGNPSAAPAPENPFAAPATEKPSGATEPGNNPPAPPTAPGPGASGPHPPPGQAAAETYPPPAPGAAGPYPPPGPGAAGPYPPPPGAGARGVYPPPPGGGPYGYQTWGQGYSPYNRPTPVNGAAIASLVLGILCCVPGAGLLLGLVALGQIRRSGDRGKGMAVAGSVLSSIGIVLWALMLATGGLTGIRDGIEAAVGEDGTAYALTVGECFDAPDGSLEGYAYHIDDVPCDGEHDGEVFAAFTVTGHDSYPGDDEVATIADTRCYQLRYGYAMDVWAVPADVDVYYLTPTGSSWELGDHEVTCLFGNTDEGAGLTGSLRNDESLLDVDQYAYLAAVNLENKVLDEEPMESADDDFEANRAWAGRMSGTLLKEVGQLRGHTWPEAARKPVAEIADEVATLQKEWAKAARAEDADAFYVHYDRITELSAPDRSVTARKALGLATTPPADGSDGSGGASGGGDSGLEV